MAKQNVTFVERHLEKFIVGLCAAVLLVIAYLYFVQDPHQVTVGGESVGPKTFYGGFTQKANAALEKMRRATLPQENKDPTAPKLADAGKKPPAEVGVAFVMPGLPVPKVPQIAPVPPVALANILPPSRPVTTTGHATALLPPPQVFSISGQDQPPPPQPPQLTDAKDAFWITTIATVDRKKQKEVFDAAKYAERRSTLVLAGIEMERQERLPNGDWSDSQAVQPYVPVHFLDLHDVELGRGESGNYETTPESDAYVGAFRQRTDSIDVQAAIMRPPLQAALLKDRAAWTPPRKLTNPDLDLTDPMWGIWFYTPDPLSKGGAKKVTGSLRSPMGGPGGQVGGPAMPPEGGAANPGLEFKKQLDEAKEHIKKQEYLEAGRILTALAENPNPIPEARVWTSQAQKLLEQHKTEIDEANKMAAVREQLKERAKTAGFGLDLEPVWAHDMTVVPGRTYRYRIRFLAVNQYAGMPSYVKDPKDAMKMVCPGSWSEWSEPQMAEPDKRLFFTGAKEDTQTARMEYHQWADGTWRVDNLDIGIGQAVAGGTKRPFSYDAVLADIDFHRPWVDRSARKDGQIKYEAKAGAETQVVTLVKLDGSVEERIAAQEAVERRAFQLKKEEERRRQEQQQPDMQQFNPVSPLAPIGPGPGEMGPGNRRGMRGRMMEEGT